MKNKLFKLFPVFALGLVLFGCDVARPPVWNNVTISQQCYGAIYTSQSALASAKKRYHFAPKGIWSRGEWALNKAKLMSGYHHFGECIAYANESFDYINRAMGYLNWQRHIH